MVARNRAEEWILGCLPEATRAALKRAQHALEEPASAPKIIGVDRLERGPDGAHRTRGRLPW